MNNHYKTMKNSRLTGDALDVFILRKSKFVLLGVDCSVDGGRSLAVVAAIAANPISTAGKLYELQREPRRAFVELFAVM